MSEGLQRKQGAAGVRLSVSMIVRNEEKFLAGCLESVRDLADEIVVVDTGSTDRTKEIARQFGVRLFEYEWRGDFSAARNYALQQCTGEWVLYLDADERLTESSRRLLPKLLSNRHADAYTVLIQNPQTMGQGRVQQENTYPRLFRRSEGVRFEGRVHEQIAPSLLRLKKRILPSTLTILHLGYDQGYDIVRKKAERNIELLELQLQSDPDDAYAQFQLGNSLVVLQRYDEAKPVLERAVSNPRLEQGNRAACYNLLAEVAVRSQRFDEAVELCKESLKLAPGQLMARWFLSLIYFDLREYDKTLDVLDELLRLVMRSASDRASQIASDVRLGVEDIRKRMAITYEVSTHYKEALEQYLQVLDVSSNAEDVIGGILRCAEKCHDSRKVVETLTKALTRTTECPELYLPLAVHCRKLGDKEKAFEYLERALTASPSSPELYATAIGWYVESGNSDAADRLCRISEERNLRSFELHKVALQAYLSRGDVHAAFRQLELMTQTTDADLSPLRNRLNALAKKLAASTNV